MSFLRKKDSINRISYLSIQRVLDMQICVLPFRIKKNQDRTCNRSDHTPRVFIFCWGTKIRALGYEK